MRRAVVLIALVLAACQSEEPGEAARDAAASQAGGAEEAPAPTVASSATAAASSLALDVEGLRLVLAGGATRLLAFGTPRAQAEQAMGGAFDDPPVRTRAGECGAGTMEFTAYGPLQLNFQDGGFVGWYLNSAGGPSTIDGVGIGSSRAQVQSARPLTMISDSTLGEEFTLGEITGENIGGLFDGPGASAKVAQLFAGINCFFR